MDKVKFIETAWECLGQVEELSRSTVIPQIAEWEPIVRNVVEAGGIAPLLPGRNQGALQLTAAGPFLKRTLTDLRTLWLLIETGYTSQAACIAASLYENALTAAVLADSEQLANEAFATKYSEIPWGAKKLAQLDARRTLRIKHKGDAYSEEEYQDGWTVSYLNYKWLCQIKHPTWQSVFHDVRAAIVSGNEYAIFPLPSNLEEDVCVKYKVLGTSVAKSLEAVKSFFLALECEESADTDRFESKVASAHFGVMDAMKKCAGKVTSVAVLNRSFIKTDFSTLEDCYEREVEKMEEFRRGGDE